jgi:hypothetical protein
MIVVESPKLASTATRAEVGIQYPVPRVKNESRRLILEVALFALVLHP